MALLKSLPEAIHMNSKWITESFRNSNRSFFCMIKKFEDIILLATNTADQQSLYLKQAP